MPPHPRRAEVYWVDFSPTRGSEQAGHRPAVVVSNDSMNRASSVVIVLPVTTNLRPFPWKVVLPAGLPLDKQSAVLCNQPRTIAKARLGGGPLGALTDDQMAEVETTLKAQLGMT